MFGAQPELQGRIFGEVLLNLNRGESRVKNVESNAGKRRNEH